MPDPTRGVEVESLPVTPALPDGTPPGWVVMCLSCGFAVDAHGAAADDAVKAVAPVHEPGHRLIATAVDYTQGMGEKTDQAHPLYRRSGGDFNVKTK